MVIYKTTNKINGKIYIGKDEKNDPMYLGSGYILKKAIEKYGIHNFTKEILEECKSSDILEKREIFWIAKYNSTNTDIGYNITDGGTGGNTYKYKTEEELNLIKKKISNAGKGRVFSDEHKKLLSEAASSRKGNKPCKFKGMSMDEYLGRDKSIEIKNKISESLKNHYKDGMSEEQKKKISDKMKGRKLGPMSDSHKRKLKESFKKRDIRKRQKLIESYIEQLDFYLENGITNENNDKAKSIYNRAKNKGVDLSKYANMLNEFKAISFERRSNAQKKTIKDASRR